MEKPCLSQVEAFIIGALIEFYMITRRKTRIVQIGNLKMGSDFPVAVQSMAQTRTEDVKKTVAQIRKMEKEGCNLVRVAVPTMLAARSLGEIKKRIRIPLIADIHFDYRLALEAIKNGADKIRINPGNIGGEEKVLKIIALAKKHKIAIRIGVNSGSLESELMDRFGSSCPQAMAKSALNWIGFFEKNNFRNLVVSVKSSNVQDMVEAYKLVAAKCDYPLHIGVTESGVPPYATIKSAIGIGALLLAGIGDTIRVSSADSSVAQIQTAKQILKAVGLNDEDSEIIACPTCGRKQMDVHKIAGVLEDRLKMNRPSRSLKIAVLGCTVNVAGESHSADFTLCGGGHGKCAIFKKNKLVKWVAESAAAEELMDLIKKCH